MKPCLKAPCREAVGMTNVNLDIMTMVDTREIVIEIEAIVMDTDLEEEVVLEEIAAEIGKADLQDMVIVKEMNLSMN